MQILELPEEVLVKIFRRCSTYEIFKRLALVCTNFYRISKDAEVIKEIKLAGCNSPIRDDESYKYLYEVIKRSSGLTKFTIEQRADNHKLINMVLQSILFNIGQLSRKQDSLRAARKPKNVINMEKPRKYKSLTMPLKG